MADRQGSPVAATGRRIRLLNTVVDAMDRDQFLARILLAAESRERLMVLNHNMHSLALCQNDPGLRELFERADLVFVDGTSVVLLGRAAGHPLSVTHRHAVLDWFWPLLDMAAANGLRVLHVGSREPVISEALRRIAERQPKVDFRPLSGYFDHRPGSAGTEEMLEQIGAADPDLVLLGLGMPLQEHWLGAVWERLPSCPVVTVGGILGYVGGERPPAPRWMGPLGIEWLFRLATEPRRLGHRYLVEPWALAAPLARDVLRRRRRAAG